MTREEAAGITPDMIIFAKTRIWEGNCKKPHYRDGFIFGYWKPTKVCNRHLNIGRSTFEQMMPVEDCWIKQTRFTTEERKTYEEMFL